MNCEAHDTSPAATTIVFFGTHVPLGSIDARLVSHYAADIREANADHQISDAWLLLLDETSATRPPVSTVSRSLGVNTCAWTPAQLFHRLPMLFQGLTDNSSPYQREPDYHMQRYYWLHASLVLWNMTLGQQYPNARFYWRIELDVLFSGRLSTMINLTASDPADLLLHK